MSYHAKKLAFPIERLRSYPILSDEVFSTIFSLQQLSHSITEQQLSDTAYNYFYFLSNLEYSLLLAFFRNDQDYLSRLNKYKPAIINFFKLEISSIGRQDPLHDSKKYLLNTIVQFFEKIEPYLADGWQFQTTISRFGANHQIHFLQYDQDGGKVHIALFIIYFLASVFYNLNYERATFPQLQITKFFQEIMKNCPLTHEANADKPKMANKLAEIWKNSWFGPSKTPAELFRASIWPEFYHYLKEGILVNPNGLNIHSIKIPFLPLTFCFPDGYYPMPE